MSGDRHQTPHLHPETGACDCLCSACDVDREAEGLEDLCICGDCNGKCGQDHVSPAPVGCRLCTYLPVQRKCITGDWEKPGFPPVEQVMRFWLAHGINPGTSNYQGHHAQALVDLLCPEVRT